MGIMLLHKFPDHGGFLKETKETGCGLNIS
jgi:hypothetical protein